MKIAVKMFGAVALMVGVGTVGSQAATIDLTTAGSGTLNGGTFTTPSTLVDTSGTGVFKPFLRVQSNGTESGYNTDRANTDFEFDEKAGVWTHSMTYGDLLASVSTTVNTFEFLLDINEPANQKSLISLDSVRLFNAGTNKDATGVGGAFLSFGDGSSPFDGLFTEIWNMDGDEDNTVLLDYNLVGTGSGRADMSLELSKDLFSGVLETDYILFYSAFGNTDDSDAGFEEWAFRSSEDDCPPGTPGCGLSPVPVPAGLPLILSGLGILGVLRMRSRKSA